MMMVVGENGDDYGDKRTRVKEDGRERGGKQEGDKRRRERGGWREREGKWEGLGNCIYF